MHTIPLAPQRSPHALREPDPFETRIDRLGAAGQPRRQRSPARRGGRRLGWKTWLMIDGIGLVLFLTAIVVWPPLSTCRSKAYYVGLYAGDTVEKCTRRGVAARIDRADQRLKMLVRGSGR